MKAVGAFSGKLRFPSRYISAIAETPFSRLPTAEAPRNWNVARALSWQRMKSHTRCEIGKSRLATCATI